MSKAKGHSVGAGGAEHSISVDDLAEMPHGDDLWSAEPEVAFAGTEVWEKADELTRRELVAELGHWVEGQARFRLRAQKAKQAGDVKRLAPYRKLIATFARPLAETLQQVRDEDARVKNPRNRYRWLEQIAALGSAEVAGVVMETIVGAASSGRQLKLSALSHSVGQALERGVMIAEWRARNPALLKAYQDRLRKAGATSGHKQKVLIHGFNQRVDLDGGAMLDWSKPVRAALGLAMVKLSELATGGRVRIEDGGWNHMRSAATGGGFRQQSLVNLDTETMQWVSEALRRGEMRSTTLKPMLCEPVPWTSSGSGGYLLHVDGSATNLVIGELRSAREVRRRVDIEKPELVFTALDLLGRTAWRVNARVLAVAKEAMRPGIDLPGLPVEIARPRIPRKPHDIETNAEARKRWRIKKARAIEAAKRQMGKALSAARIVAEAERYTDEPAIYFPHHVDWRCRAYTMPSALSIQGPDLAKGLLEFAEGGEIKTKQQEDWLAAHVGRCFGQGRKSIADRIAWAHANGALVRRIADDPLGNRGEWVEAAGGDDIWTALAAACEWVAYLDARRRGEVFVTHLPVQIDGSANGIQHLAAMAGDAELAALVNLMPSTAQPGTGEQFPASDQPSDIYLRLGDELAEKIKHAAVIDGDPLAKGWRRLLGNHPPRDLVKPVVMTLPFGVTHRRIVELILESLSGEIDPQGRVFAAEDQREAAVWLADMLTRLVKKRLASAIGVMRWLGETAGAVAKSGTTAGSPATGGMSWTTPTGWPFELVYGKQEQHRLWATILDARTGSVSRPSVTMQVESGTKISVRQVKSSAAAHVVQACDAAALVLGLHEMECRGVKAVGAIHDCVVGLATDMDVIGEAVRRGFVKLHAVDRGVLWSIYQAALKQAPARPTKLTKKGRVRKNARKPKPIVSEPPQRGGLDAQAVMKSRYFFH